MSNPRPCELCGGARPEHATMVTHPYLPVRRKLRAKRVPVGVSAWTPRDGEWVPVRALQDFVQDEARFARAQNDGTFYYDGFFDALNKVRARFCS